MSIPHAKRGPRPGSWVPLETSITPALDRALRRVLVDDLTEYLAEHPHCDDPTSSLWPGRNYAGGGG